MPYALDGAGTTHLPDQHHGHAHAKPAAGCARQPAGDAAGSGRRSARGRAGDAGGQRLYRSLRAEVGEARRLYLERHANSKYWVDFDDFSFFGMDVVDVYYVGGFGVMGWVAAPEYSQAHPDPLADAAAGILQHMNADHQDALILLARVFAGMEAQEAVMTAVDRLGFHVRMKTEEGMKGARLAFLSEVSTPAETRKMLVEMVQQARRS